MIILALVGTLLLAHPWYLPAVGRYLAAESPFQAVDAVVVLSGDHRLRHAAELVASDQASEVWLLEWTPTYAVQAGLFPANHAVEADALRSLGVEESRIRVLPGSMQEVEDAAGMIAEAIRENSIDEVVIICNRPQGRNVRWVVNRVLEKEQLETSVNVLAAPSDQYTDANWWRRRTGWKDIFNGICQLTFTTVRGIDSRRDVIEWDADAYEREFVAEFGASGCHGAD